MCFIKIFRVFVFFVYRSITVIEVFVDYIMIRSGRFDIVLIEGIKLFMLNEGELFLMVFIKWIGK